MARTHRWDGVTPEARLRAKMRVAESGCWIWQPKVNNSGYGSFWVDGKRRLAHRASFIIFKGPIPEGLTIDHLCRHRACVNPAHLEAVTLRINLLRGIGGAAAKAAQTHCKRGHEFTPENTYRSKRNERVCRACHAARQWGRRYGYDTDTALAVRAGLSLLEAA